MPSSKLLLQIPTDLICDPKIPPLAKALFVTLVQLGPCSLRELGLASNLCRDATRQRVGLLVQTGWAVVYGGRNRKVVAASYPEKTQRELIEKLREIRNVSSPVGENLSKVVLDVEVDDDQYIDNARPHFLQNPETGEYLELDRWYFRRKAGEEYDSSLHFVVTSIVDKKKLEEIQARDALKAELCRAKGIPLMIITEDDLSLDGILAKIPPQLPKARLNRKDPYVQALEEVCEEYVASCRRARLREAREKEKEKDGGRRGGS